MTVLTVAVPDLLGTSPADLIDRWAEQPVATRDVATRRAERIRTGVASYAAMRQDIADAYAQRDWLALDYDTWHAYVQGEFGAELRKLTGGRNVRRQAVADRRAEGMSTRQIAGALGVAQSVVRDDLKVSGIHSPATVTGSDGKTYAAAKPVSAPPAPASPERPKPPAWDPEDRKRHEEEVQRIQAIEAARRTANTIVTTVLAEVVTVVTGSRYGEKGLVTREMVAKLREAIDLLEGEIDGEE